MSALTPFIRSRTNPDPLPTLHAIGGYRLLRLLGAGGMSEVYLAYDTDRARAVAVKILPDELAKNSTFVNRFRLEASLGQVLDHPHIVRCFESGEDLDKKRHYLVMEFVKGQSAQTYLDRHGPFSLADATQIIIDIAHALEELHYRQYVHRDVKPGNILINTEGRAKLADLGVAKLLTDATELTSLDQGIGTPYYMPWEQTLNAGLVDPRTDLFALGATYYHLVTGKVPFAGKNVAEVNERKQDGTFKPVREINPAFPRTLDTVLAKMMARMPSERFQSARQLVDVLVASGLAEDQIVTTKSLSDTDVPPAVTRPDLKTAGSENRKKEDTWVVQYRNPGFGWKRLKATPGHIAQWFEEGILPDEFYVGREGDKKLKLFRLVEQFKTLERKVKPTEPPEESEEKAMARFDPLICIGLTGIISILTTTTVATALHVLCSRI